MSLSDTPREMRLDPEIKLFVDTVQAAYGQYPNFGDRPFPEMRAIAEIVRAPWREGGPVMVSIQDAQVPTSEGDVLVRIHNPSEGGPKPALIYLHGGGWTFFSLNTHDRVMREYAGGADMVVVGVDYSLSPEVKFPVALNQVVGVVEWLREHGADYGIDVDQLAICGDSCGANMSVSAALMLRDKGQGDALKGMVLNYGFFDDDATRESYDLYGQDGEILSRAELQSFWVNYLADPADAANPLVLPLHADLHDLPPALFAVPECDPLYDESVVMTDLLVKAGVPAEMITYKGATHSFLEAVSVAQVSRQAFADASRWLNSVLKRQT